MKRPSGRNSSPQAYAAPSRPPRAANSHSASVGSVLAFPLCKGFRIRKRDVHDRVLVAFPRWCCRAPAAPARSAPRRNCHQFPSVAAIDRPGRLDEHKRRRHTASRAALPDSRRDRGTISADVTWPVASTKRAEARVRHRDVRRSRIHPTEHRMGRRVPPGSARPIPSGRCRPAPSVMSLPVRFSPPPLAAPTSWPSRRRW